MLIASYAGGTALPLTFSWDQAVADGAGINAYDPGLPQIPVPITVHVRGDGIVSASGDGGDCATADCALTVTQGVAATLRARSRSGWSFAGWSGACSGTGTCMVTMSGTRLSVTARFVRRNAASVRIGSVRLVHGTDLQISIRALSGVVLHCALRRKTPSGRFAGTYRRCGATFTRRHIRSGTYRFSVTSSRGNTSTSFRIAG
jgi:hypothetical protein